MATEPTTCSADGQIWAEYRALDKQLIVEVYWESMTSCNASTYKMSNHV